MKKIAIMQPTYLPWSGYFGLMQYVDIFVFLDSVQFERRSWQQRNKIKTRNGEKIISIPVLSKGKRDQKIKDVIISEQSNFQELSGTFREAAGSLPAAAWQLQEVSGNFQDRGCRLPDPSRRLRERSCRTVQRGWVVIKGRRFKVYPGSAPARAGGSSCDRRLTGLCLVN